MIWYPTVFLTTSPCELCRKVLSQDSIPSRPRELSEGK